MGSGYKYTKGLGQGAVRMWKHADMKLNKQLSPILNSPILVGRVLPGRTPFETASGFRPGDLDDTRPEVEVRVPYYIYDAYFKAFFQHEWDFLVSDSNKEAMEGDTVLIKKLAEADMRFAESISLRSAAEDPWWIPKVEEKDVFKRKDVTHSVESIIYRLGDVVDPITKEAVVSDRYRSEIKRVKELYGPSKADFDYEKAPPRGRLHGKRDFTDRRTYKKWNVFKKHDPYGIVS